MTKQLRFLAVGLLMAASQAATASNSLSDFPLRTLPVLVSVDASGKVTDASPAMQLPPAIKRLLLTNLDEMVSGPAHSKDKPISSQCIINVALKATRRDDGNYDAGFTYLSTQPVPIGRWHWVNLDGRRLMLASDDYPRRMYPDRLDANPRSEFRSMPAHAPAPVPTPTANSAAAPSAAPARGR
jgi:hypothetical protein